LAPTTKPKAVASPAPYTHPCRRRFNVVRSRRVRRLAAPIGNRRRTVIFEIRASPALYALGRRDAAPPWSIDVQRLARVIVLRLLCPSNCV
jgi:hypothetical protein